MARSKTFNTFVTIAPGDKRPVWVIRPDGAAAHVVESLRYQCAMDGSRAAWKPLEAK